MTDTERQETQTTETEEEPMSALDELLSKVTLLDPIEVPMNNGQLLVITPEQFISYYLPNNATSEEKANCFNEVRAAGLNPAIRGDCHFFRTADQPMRLFIGYHVYLRYAWANGLKHIQKPEIEFGEDGHPFTCTITLEIEGRPDFEWTTWFWEVAATNRDGKLNKRWEKAEIQMFIKCSLMNSFRISGLVDLTLPPAIEEMGTLLAPGHRTLTQPQLDVYKEDAEEQEAVAGEITAATHQADTSGLRRKYFQLLKELEPLGLSFADDEERRAWQKDHLDRESISDVSAEDWPDILMKVTEIKMGLVYGDQKSEANEEVQEPMTDEELEAEKQKAREAAKENPLQRETDPIVDDDAKPDEPEDDTIAFPSKEEVDAERAKMQAELGKNDAESRGGKMQSVMDLLKDTPMKDIGTPGYKTFAKKELDGKAGFPLSELSDEDLDTLIEALNTQINANGDKSAEEQDLPL